MRQSSKVPVARVEQAASSSPARRPRGWFASLGRSIGGQNAGLLIALAGLVALIGSQRPNFFLPANLLNIGVAVSLLGLVSLAQTVAIVSGGLDISIGTAVGLATVVAAMGTEFGVAGGIIAGLAAGLATGLLNGVLILYGRVNPIITTLATYSVFRGLTFIAAGGTAIGVSDSTFLFLGSGRLFGIPVPLVLLVLASVLFFVMLRYSVVGRNIYAMGGNPAAARLAGIRLSRYTVGIYVTAGLVAGVAGVLLTAKSGAGIANSGAENLSLQSIAAVLLGGSALTGGKGGVAGTLLAVALIGVLQNGLVLLNVPQFYQLVAQGVLLLGAVMIQEYRTRRSTGESPIRTVLARNPTHGAGEA